jgi:hypothetical protein
MKLIEFLLHNWYIAVVLLFFASGFLKRLKSSGANQPKQAMPPFGGGGLGKGWGGGKVPTVTSANRSQEARGQTNASHNHTNEQVHSESAGSALIKKGEPDFWNDSDGGSHSSNERAQRLSASNNRESTSTQEKINKQKLAQGIIWAEILGPPRAKKPYGNKRY